jgi:solute carrier family 1 (neuronal/epithelial high affinity glutamate transporter), member 1
MELVNQPRGEHHLTIQIAVAIVLAVLLALLLPALVETGIDADAMIVPLSMGGEIFLSVLKMLVVPLVVASVMSGILGMGDVRQLGRPGAATVLFYITTTVLAVLVGVLLVNLIAPGVGAVDAETLEEVQRQQADRKQQLDEHLGEDAGITRILKNLVLMLFTDNLFRSAAEMDLLPLIVFSIVFAGLLTTMGKRVQLLIDFTRQMNDVLLSFVLVVMRFAPLGIFCLVAARFGEANVQGEFLEELRKTGGYTLTVLAGLALHAFVTLPAIVYVFTRRNPYRFMLQMSRPLLTAFSTASSSATLPVTMETAIDEAGISRRSVDFVLPLGATINMDGTALFEAVAALFVAQALGMELTMGQQLVVVVTATLAAIGAAGIPEAGLVTLLIVFTAIGLPTEAISLILSVDWLIDRFRTAVNVFGDACGAAVLERTFPAEEASNELNHQA